MIDSNKMMGRNKVGFLPLADLDPIDGRHFSDWVHT